MLILSYSTPQFNCLSVTITGAARAFRQESIDIFHILSYDKNVQWVSESSPFSDGPARISFSFREKQSWLCKQLYGFSHFPTKSFAPSRPDFVHGSPQGPSSERCAAGYFFCSAPFLLPICNNLS